MLNKILRQALVLALAITPLSGTFALAQEKQDAAVQTSTASAPPAEQAQPAQKTPPAPGDQQLMSAITDLNYKIEYLQASYNRLNADIEGLRLTDRDQGKLLSDRISAIPQTDASRIDKLETQSAALRSDLALARQDIAALKGKLDNKGQTAGEQSQTEKVLHSHWLAVGALGLSIIALIAH